MGKEEQYWLLKTEAGEWSWEDQAANGGVTKWDGVKNKQAQQHMKSMKLGYLCLFYHSGAKARRVVGVVKVVREWYSEGGGGDGAVDVKAVGEMRRPVDLKEMKGKEGLKGLDLFRQPSLSVVPVSGDVWMRILGLGSGYEGDGVGIELDDSDEEDDGDSDEEDNYDDSDEDGNYGSDDETGDEYYDSDEVSDDEDSDGGGGDSSDEGDDDGRGDESSYEVIDYGDSGEGSSEEVDD